MSTPMTVEESGLLGLPPELLDIVVYRLDDKTLCALRRTCKCIFACIEQAYLDRFHADRNQLYTLRSLRRLVNITATPHLRKGIRRLTLLFPPPACCDDELFDTRDPRELRYEDLEQLSSHVENECVDLLVAALKNLDTADTTLSLSFNPYRGWPWSYSEPRGSQCPFPALEDKLRIVQLRYRWVDFGRSLARALSTGLVCMAKAHTQVAELNLGPLLSGDVPSGVADFRSHNLSCISLRSQVHLSVLQISLHPSFFTDDSLIGVLPNLLRAAPNLRDLSMWGGVKSEHIIANKAEVMQLLEPLAAVRLQCLYWSCGSFSLDTICTIFEWQRHSLRKLVLRLCTINGGESWRDAFSLMAERMQLTSVQLDRLGQSYFSMRPPVTAQPALFSGTTEQVKKSLRDLAAHACFYDHEGTEWHDRGGLIDLDALSDSSLEA